MCKRHLKKSVTRRDVLRYALAGTGIAALGPMVKGLLPVAHGAPLPNHKRLVVIFAYGGYDGLSMLVPVTNSAYYSRRPTIAIPAVDALALNGSSDYALHTQMDRIASLYNNDGSVAVFRKAGYPDENLSHFESQDFFSWGVRYDFASLPIDESGWIARYADLHAPTPMGAAALGVGRPLEFEGGTTPPFLAQSLSTFNYLNAGFAGESSSAKSARHLHRMAAAQNVLGLYSGTGLPSEAKLAIEQGQQLTQQIQQAVANYSSPVVYPNTTPARYLKDAAILIQGGFETQVFFTGFSGWDTHGSQGASTGTMANLVMRLDDAVGAFADDCKNMGVWDDTLVLIMSEFGRRNFENGSAGCDHGHGNTFFAVGGNVNGGLYGPDLTVAEVQNQNWLGYSIDFRDIYKEAVADHMGHDPLPIWPEPQVINQNLGYV